MISILREKCIGCRTCEDACSFGALTMEDGYPHIDDSCKNCNACVNLCPEEALTAEEVNREINLDDFRGFWVVGLETNEKLQNVSKQLLSKARELADKRNTSVTFVAASEKGTMSWEKELSALGCDEFLQLCVNKSNPMDKDFIVGALNQAIVKYKPEAVLFPATIDGREIAPRVAVRVQTGLTADCTGLDVDEEGNMLQIRPTYGGSIMATIKTPNHRPQMASIRPNVFEVKHCGQKALLKKTELQVSDEKSFGRVILEELRQNDSAFGNLEDAKIIIAGGYGLGSKENFEKLIELCRRLNATAAATRKAVDEGWAPAQIQVGQTGKTVAPDIYLAIGISGALQHMLGMNHAGKIIAINNDPAAPIFSMCDQAVLGDAEKIIDFMLKSTE